MKNAIVALLLMSSYFLSAQSLKPYTTGAYSSTDLTTTVQTVKSKLSDAGFKILGEYRPASDPNRWIIAFTSDDILAAVRKVGGLSGFAAAWRVAVTNEDGQVHISYNTPAYWGNAYFRKNYSKVSSLYDSYADKIANALAQCGTGGGKQFGSKTGKTPKQLQNYHYKVMMPYFNDTKKLGEFDSFDAAVAHIDAKLAAGVEGISKVYSIKVPGKNLKLYGIATSGAGGEKSYIHKIDTDVQKHTAFFPYELLVVDNHVHMLHGRFRIAVSFPDTSMGEFMKIMSAPGDILDHLKRAVH